MMRLACRTDAEATTLTEPAGVNLMALPIRLTRICLNRVGSLIMRAGNDSSRFTLNSRCFSAAKAAIDADNSCKVAAGENGTSSKLVLPASIFEKSRMPPTVSSSECAEKSRAFNMRCCSSLNLVSDSILAVPRTTVMGVRISWLMLARNCDLVLDASRALSRAALSSRFAIANCADRVRALRQK